jgi:hypothetical protein
MTNADKEWFRSYLADRMHAAFGKLSDHSCSAFTIHRLIHDMDSAEWSGIITFVSDAMMDGMKNRKMLATRPNKGRPAGSIER